MESSPLWKIADKILFPFLFPLLHVAPDRIWVWGQQARRTQRKKRNVTMQAWGCCQGAEMGWPLEKRCPEPDKRDLIPLWDSVPLHVRQCCPVVLSPNPDSDLPSTHPYKKYPPVIGLCVFAHANVSQAQEKDLPTASSLLGQ